MKAIKLAREKIDLIFMPWMYDDKNYQKLMPFLKHNEKLITVGMHHEQIGSATTDITNLPTSENAKNSVLHLVWGSSFKDMLVQNGVREELIYEVGHMRLDTAGTNIKSKDELATESGIDKLKKWLLFGESRDWIWSYPKNKYMFSARGYSSKDLEEMYVISRKSLIETLESFKNIDDKFFNGFEIIYRPHPGTVTLPKLYIDDRVKCINKHSIYDWLGNADERRQNL